MPKEASPLDAIPSSVKLEAMIGMLTLFIKIGKYLPYIVLAFALLNLTLAILDFVVWGHFVTGVLNSILAFAGFLFFGQLMQRRKIHRYEYRYMGRHLHKVAKNEDTLPRSESKAATEA